MRQQVEGVPPRERERQREAVVQVVFAARRHRTVDGDDEAFESGGPGALDELVRERTSGHM